VDCPGSLVPLLDSFPGRQWHGVSDKALMSLSSLGLTNSLLASVRWAPSSFIGILAFFVFYPAINGQGFCATFRTLVRLGFVFLHELSVMDFGVWFGGLDRSVHMTRSHY
jgi:hypothetical protein